MTDRLQTIWQKLKDTETVALIGAGAGLLGAATGLIAAIASVWTLHDQWRTAAQEAEANKPIVNLRNIASDQIATWADLTISNPGNTAYLFTEIIVKNPFGWKAVPFIRPNVVDEPDFKGAGIAILTRLMSYPQKASSSSSQVHQLLIIERSDVAGDERNHMISMPLDKIPDDGVELIVKGHALNSDGEAIEIEVKETPTMTFQ